MTSLTTIATVSRSAVSRFSLVAVCLLALSACGGGGGGGDVTSGGSTGGGTSNPTTQVPDSTNTGAFMPVIDVSRIPAAVAGYSTERLRSTTEQPSGSDGTGNFRTVCDFSHMAFDDPIVLPGQPGASHLHTFFGNTAVTGNSTAASIANSGNSTCRGGIVNRSAYWVPSMIDTRDGTPQRPLESNFYYKTGYNGVAPGTVQSLPSGLRMIAGDAKNAAPSGPFSYSCHSATAMTQVGAAIPNCPVGTQLQQHIVFPQCWDGVNLDSPDHKSHMAYPTAGRGCPSSHPVPLPEITFNIVYLVTEANSTQRWRLSSDNYSTSLPGGYSAHGDWFNGWRADIMDTFVRYCDRAAVDCGSHLLGDGRVMY